MPPIPSVLFLYIRKTKNDLILMNVTSSIGPGLTFTPVTMPVAMADNYEITKPSGPSIGVSYGTHAVRTKENTVMSKRFHEHPDILAKSPTGEIIPVFSIASPYTVFGYILPNPVLPTVIKAPTSLLSSAPPTPVSTAMAAAVAEIKKKRARAICGSSTLAPFVAKQLFDLAVIRKEQCPVTMEDFSEGNTAVMPCGHLFMQFAIEESFKKEDGKCPWCRQAGQPTYV